MSGKVVLWLAYFYDRIVGSMSYLKLRNCIYCLSRRQRQATEGPPKTTGDHRGQFPRTDFGPVTESSPPPTPPGPLKLRFLGEVLLPNQASLQRHKRCPVAFVPPHPPPLLCLVPVLSGKPIGSGRERVQAGGGMNTSPPNDHQ